MTHQITVAFDEATAHRLKRLAARGKVSKSEVVRRALEQAEKAELDIALRDRSQPGSS